jgi:NAD(P)-dependent dehydrogenase (short-subunit alcohol dehydrogenase family)
MQINGRIALVTGANRGLGLAFVRTLLARGATKVYAAAREPSAIAAPGAVPIALDVTKPEQIAAAAREAADVELVINNAGVSRRSPLLAADALASARVEFETNALGPLAVSRAFAPVLASHGGGAIINVLSVLSWFTLPGVATYSASKAAAWSITNGLRTELQTQGTQVVGVHVAFIDTDMARAVQLPKVQPADVANAALDALEAGETEVLVDDIARNVKQMLSQGVYLAPPRVR